MGILILLSPYNTNKDNIPYKGVNTVAEETQKYDSLAKLIAQLLVDQARQDTAN